MDKEKVDPSKFLPGDLKIPLLLKSLKGDKKTDGIILSKLHLNADQLNNVTEEQFIDVFNYLLNLPDFFRLVDTQKYRDLLPKKMQGLLDKASIIKNSIPEPDRLKLKRSIISAIYPGVVQTRRSAWREWGESILIAFILAMIIRSFVIQAFKIPTGSMRMTLLEGDAILVNKFLYGPKIPFTDIRLPGIRQPKRGDVVVFVYPKDTKKDFIKRLVATEGESVAIINGTIYVNDLPLTAPPFNTNYYYNRGDFGEAGGKIVVPKDSYFVMGDNSASSQDSRYWGFVPKNNVVGKAILIYWPLTRIRLIK